MSNTKSNFQNRIEKWKTAASQLVSANSAEHDYRTVELDPHTYEMCRQMADTRQTTVQDVVNVVIAQFLSGRPNGLPRATLEQKEKNPLLHLDALTKKLNDRDKGGAKQ